MRIDFERLVSRRVGVFMQRLIDLSGTKINLNTLLEYLVLGFFVLFIVSGAVMLFVLKLSGALSFFIGLLVGLIYIVVIYGMLNYQIDKRTAKMESILPEYFQLVAANLKSGMSIDRSMLLASRPEFSPFSEDVHKMNNKLFSGESLERGLHELSDSYKSNTLNRSVRLIIEAQRFGGKMADLINDIAKDIRDQQLIQKEISGQLFMYSIFIAFAGLVAAPVLYGLTSQMIKITDTVWKGILASNPGGLPSTGATFLKPQPPLITIGEYHTFSLLAIIIITGCAAIIMAAINSGKPVRGIRMVPVFIIMGLAIFLIVSTVVGGLFGSIG
ncbi:MAG: type II secretion system F family protein [Candidatus Marsarchaeota archaeon]|jgi:hypothetical protein|nr:type II secretion system F family protein [Candidatus Marsarchaeota archaeon]